MKYRKFHVNKNSFFNCDSGQTLGQVAWNGSRVSIFAATQKTTLHSHEQTGLNYHCFRLCDLQMSLPISTVLLQTDTEQKPSEKQIGITQVKGSDLRAMIMDLTMD